MKELKLSVQVERWPLVRPFRITGYTWEAIDTLLVILEREGAEGRGEASGVYYHGEYTESMIAQIESARSRIEAGISTASLQTVLPPGGARNAVDCALWDLEAKLAGRAVWQLLGMAKPQPLQATFTCSADEPENMAAAALSYRGAQAIKVKLTGEAADAARICAVREACNDVTLRIDANQGFTRESLQALMPVLMEARVDLIEQPFPVGRETLLDGLASSIPLAADESVQCLPDIARLGQRFQVVNIKLDKCGGLTEALAMVRYARERGLGVMVGNMLGTSLAMAPGYLLGQLCDVVELDAPIALKADREPPVQYRDGLIICPDSLWGSATGSAR